MEQKLCQFYTVSKLVRKNRLKNHCYFIFCQPFFDTELIPMFYKFFQFVHCFYDFSFYIINFIVLIVAVFYNEWLDVLSVKVIYDC